MTAIHEDAAVSHTLCVLLDEDAHGSSHVLGRQRCRDLLITTEVIQFLGLFIPKKRDFHPPILTLNCKYA